LDINMKDTISQVIQQIEQHFPVISVESGQRYVLIDYTEIMFTPGLVHQVMKNKPPNKSLKVLTLTKVSFFINRLDRYLCKINFHSY